MKNSTLKRALSILLALFMLTSCFSISAMAVGGDRGALEVVDASASVGGIAEVKLDITANPGIAGMQLKVEFDDTALKLVEIVDGGLLGASFTEMHETSPQILLWSNFTITENITAIGTIATLKFEVKEGAAEGSYPITVSYDNVNGDDIINVALSRVEFDITSGAVTVSNVESEFTYADMALDTDIAMTYYATLAPAQTNAKVRFTMNNNETEVSGVATGNANEYMFTFNNIAPQCMGDNIKAELILGGEVLDTSDNYSIRQYCLNTLAKGAAGNGMSETKFAALKTLIADILEYGAKAQVYKSYKTNALVNAGIEGASEYEQLDDSVEFLIEDSKSGTVMMKYMGVKFDYTNSIYIKFEAPGMTDETCYINVTSFDDGDYFKEILLSDCYLVDADTSTYLFELDAANLTKYGEFFLVRLYAPNSRGRVSIVQELEISVESYIYELQNQNNGGILTPMAQLARALRNYGASAAAYSAAV